MQEPGIACSSQGNVELLTAAGADLTDSDDLGRKIDASGCRRPGTFDDLSLGRAARSCRWARLDCIPCTLDCMRQHNQEAKDLGGSSASGSIDFPVLGRGPLPPKPCPVAWLATRHKTQRANWLRKTAHQLRRRRAGGCFAQPACAPQTMRISPGSEGTPDHWIHGPATQFCLVDALAKAFAWHTQIVRGDKQLWL